MIKLIYINKNKQPDYDENCDADQYSEETLIKQELSNCEKEIHMQRSLIKDQVKEVLEFVPFADLFKEPKAFAIRHENGINVIYAGREDVIDRLLA